VKVKTMDSNCAWEIISIYRTTDEDKLSIERLAARNVPTRNLSKGINICGD